MRSFRSARSAGAEEHQEALAADADGEPDVFIGGLGRGDPDGAEPIRRASLAL
jgi:hypothetical protein